MTNSECIEKHIEKLKSGSEQYGKLQSRYAAYSTEIWNLIAENGKKLIDRIMNDQQYADMKFELNLINYIASQKSYGSNCSIEKPKYGDIAISFKKSTSKVVIECVTFSFGEIFKPGPDLKDRLSKAGLNSFIPNTKGQESIDFLRGRIASAGNEKFKKIEKDTYQISNEKFIIAFSTWDNFIAMGACGSNDVAAYAFGTGLQKILITDKGFVSTTQSTPQFKKVTSNSMIDQAVFLQDKPPYNKISAFLYIQNLHQAIGELLFITRNPYAVNKIEDEELQSLFSQCHVTDFDLYEDRIRSKFINQA